MLTHRMPMSLAAGCALALLLPWRSAIATPSWSDLADFELCPGMSAAMARPAGIGERDVSISTFTHHWTHSDEHKNVRSLNLRQHLDDDRFCGFSLFTNSFGQPSTYLFTGKFWPEPIPGLPRVYASVSAGMLYGYVSRYKNKVPLNVKGFSPAIVPSIGFRITPQLSIEAHVLGTAALMIGADWWY
ncbi:MAG: hypothetical protein KDF54_04730 [Hydrogenophaga sp.]|nr:hypothetical protein [Hydrogenophaga sp.]